MFQPQHFFKNKGTKRSQWTRGMWEGICFSLYPTPARLPWTRSLTPWIDIVTSLLLSGFVPNIPLPAQHTSSALCGEIQLCRAVKCRLHLEEGLKAQPAAFPAAVLLFLLELGVKITQSSTAGVELGGIRQLFANLTA